MKKSVFIRDEKGAILIMGAFFLLFVGMWLLALSLDLPMTFNREESAQAMIRQATSAVAKQMQYAKISARLQQEMKKGDAQYLDLTIKLEDTKTTENTSLAWEGQGYNYNPSNFDLSDPAELNDFLNQKPILLKAQADMEAILANRMPKRACVLVKEVKQNDDDKNYLYAYMDYPTDSIFDKAASGDVKTKNTTGCDCLGDKPSEGCNRVVSGQMFSDEIASEKASVGGQPAVEGQPWEVFRDGLRTEIVVETSHKTINAPFDFIGYALTLVDESLGYAIGDDEDDTDAGYIRFDSFLHAPLADSDLNDNMLPVDYMDGGNGVTEALGGCKFITGTEGSWSGCLAGDWDDISVVPSGKECRYYAVQYSSYSPRIDIARLKSRACWDPVWSHKVGSAEPVVCKEKMPIEEPRQSAIWCEYTMTTCDNNLIDPTCTPVQVIGTCCEAWKENDGTENGVETDAYKRCNGECDIEDWYTDANSMCWRNKSIPFTKVTWDDECSLDNAHEVIVDNAEKVLENPDNEFGDLLEQPVLDFKLYTDLLAPSRFTLEKPEETEPYAGYYAVFGSFISEGLNNTWLSLWDNLARFGKVTKVGEGELHDYVTHAIFDFQGYPIIPNHLASLINMEKYFGPFVDKCSSLKGFGCDENKFENIDKLEIKSYDEISYIDGGYRIKNPLGGYVIPSGRYLLTAKPNKLYDGVPNPEDAHWCGRVNDKGDKKWIQGPKDKACILRRDKADEIVESYVVNQRICPSAMGDTDLLTQLQEDVKKRCIGPFDSMCSGYYSLEYQDVMDLEVIQDNPKQKIYIDKLFVDSSVVENYAHKTGEEVEETADEIARRIKEDDIYDKSFNELLVENAIVEHDYSKSVWYEDIILSYDKISKTRWSTPPFAGIITAKELQKIKDISKDGGKDWKTFMLAKEEPAYGAVIRTPNYFDDDVPYNVDPNSFSGGFVAYATDEEYVRLGEIYVPSVGCSGTAAQNTTTKFGGDASWNKTRDHMKEHLPTLRQEANGQNSSAWCPAIKLAVDILMNSNEGDCNSPHQRCVLPLFVGEPPDYCNEFLLDKDGNCTTTTLGDVFVNDEKLQLEDNNYREYTRKQQYDCANIVLDKFKAKGGIVIVVGLEGLGVTDKPAFAKWIAEASGDVDQKYLVGQRGMFLPTPRTDGSAVTKLEYKIGGKTHDLTATKADVIQSLIWNYTPNTIEVCQGNSCD